MASTFSGNSATGNGADIDSGDTDNGNAPEEPATATIAANVFTGSCGQHASTWHDPGFNVGVDASCFSSSTAVGDRNAGSSLPSLLGPLAPNGGPTETIALLSGNPAIANIPTTGSITLPDGSLYTLCPVAADQRGIPSPAGDHCDSGAIQAIGLPTTVTGSQTYGSPSPTFSTTTVPPAGDSFSGTPRCTTVDSPPQTIGPSLPAGSHQINGASCSGLSLTGSTAGNYVIDYRGSTFVVNPAPLTVDAPSASAYYGNVPGTFTPTYKGLVNGETAPATPPTCSSDATNTSPPGTYQITCSGAKDPNYTISYGAPGVLTITKAPTRLEAAPAHARLLSITFSATLTRADDDAGVAGKTIAFSVQGRTLCRATTDGSGVASCTVTGLVLVVGQASYTAGFAGDDDYLGSNASAQLS